MTSPMVDSVRSIPLVVERGVYEPMEVENDDSGFPFDERDDRDDHFRSQLDDIAKRHPEFAEHLEGFPFRSETLGRRRPPRPDQDARFTNRPFGSGRFERFGFPFSDAFDEDFQPTSPPPQPPTEPHTQPKEEDRPKPERGRKQNIQQSNTVDLGQKQEPVNDRNQRSMSAPPPDNRQRYVSSIHIPINRDGGMGDMGKTQSQPQPDNKPVERVIPIHVEGRDEPVLPKHTGPSFSQPQSQPQPQPERIFGHSPSHFTQFVPKQPEWHHQGFGPEVKQQQKFQQATPPPQERPIPAQKPQEKREEPKEEFKEVPKTNTPIDLIQSIQKDVSELMGQVENFAGLPRDKQYLYLDEMLTRNLIKLDNIDTQGQENIRQARKEAIKCIQSCINILEAKANANVPKQAEDKASEEVKAEEPFTEANPSQAESVVEAKMEVEEKEKSVEKEITEVKPAGETVTDKVEAPAEGTDILTEEKMEVASEAAPEEKPQETQVSETTDSKPDEEMKEVPSEESKEATQEDTSEDKTEKKKGKKKVVKK